MGLRRGRGALVVTAAATLAACSLTTSLDGLSGGPLDANGAETGQSTDAGAVDARPGADASEADTDAGPDASSFCATINPRPTLCDDFERTDLQGAWDSVVQYRATVGIEPSTRGSGRELHALLPSLASSTDAVGGLSGSFGVANEILLSFALRVDAAPAGSNGVQLMDIDVVPSPASTEHFSVCVFVTPTGITLAEQTFPAASNSTFHEGALAEPLAFGSWQRVDIHLTLAPAPHVKVTVDGKASYERAPDPFFKPGKAQIIAGIGYAFAPGGPLSARVDDVYVDVK